MCPEFNKIFRNRQFIKKVSEIEASEKHFDELIEKLVIVNLLSYDEFKNFIFSGVNPLKELFMGLFKDYPLEKVLETYKKYYHIYCESLMEVFCDDLERISNYESEGRRLLKNYNQEIKGIEAENRNEILIDKYTLEKYMEFGFQLLMIQIGNNIRKRELKGENLISTKLALKKLFVNGIKTKQTVDNYNELLAEANSQLGIFKLPKSFRKFEKKIKETLLENYKEMIGENFEEACFEAIKKIQQESYELNNEERIVKTGAEPELTVRDIKKLKKNVDFFKQANLLEHLLENNQSLNAAKLNPKSSYTDKDNSISKENAIFSGKFKISREVSIEQIENEILKLRMKLGIENKEDYYLDEEQKNLNIDLVKKKVKAMKDEKFKSITSFNEYSKDEPALLSSNTDTSRENDNISSDKNIINDAKNINFFNQRNLGDNTSILYETQHKELQRLEAIRELKLGMKEEIENSLKECDLPELNPMSYINLDIFNGKSLEQLKSLEIEQLHESNMEISGEGQVRENSVQIGDGFYKYSVDNMMKNSSTINLSDQQAETNYQMAYEVIKKDLVNSDNARAQKIVNALEKGEYLDDPYYIALLMQSKKYMKIREKYLQKYFKEGSLDDGYRNSSNLRNAKYRKNSNKATTTAAETGQATPLLDKYIKKPGNIVDNMLADGVFAKHESEIGKTYVNLLQEYISDLDAEENQSEKNLSLNDYENHSLKKTSQEGNFNIYELNKKLNEQHDDFYVSKEDIEKELGWKKINTNKGAKENLGLGEGNFLETDSLHPGLMQQQINDYVPGSKKGSLNKKKGTKLNYHK